MQQRGEAGLLADLSSLAIPFEMHEHQPVFTVDESRGIEADIPGEHTKNLFLKDTGGAFLLLTVPAKARVDLKALPNVIGCKRVSFGKPEDMLRLLGIKPGSVTPLAMINALPGSITCVLVAALAQADQVNVHPLRNTATIGVSGPNIVRLLRYWKHDPIIAEISQKE